MTGSDVDRRWPSRGRYKDMVRLFRSLMGTRRSFVTVLIASWFLLVATAPPASQHTHVVNGRHPSSHIHHVGHRHGSRTSDDDHHHGGDEAVGSSCESTHWHVWLAGIEWTVPVTGGNKPSGPFDGVPPTEITSTTVTAVAISPGQLVSGPLDILLTQSAATIDSPVAVLRPAKAASRAGPIRCDVALKLRSGVQLI
jgi:hypothetical protein